MKHLLGKKMLLSLFALGMCVMTNAQQVLHINLEQALEIALNENPTIKVADMEIERKEYVRKETQGDLLPNISASAGYNRTLKKQVMYMGSGGGLSSMILEPLEGIVRPLYDELKLQYPDLSSGEEDSGDGAMTVGLDNNWSGGFNLSIPIFAPSLYKAIKLTALDIEVSIEAARASRQDLVNQVTKAYYQLLLAQDSYDVLEISYNQAVDNYDIVNNKFLQGVVSEYDKIRAEVQVHNLKPSLVQAKNAITLTKLQLKVLMGVDAGLDVEIMGSLDDYEEKMYADILRVDTTTLVNNSDLRTLEIQDRILRETLKLNKTAYMPTLALTGSYQWIAMNDDFRFKNYNWNPYSVVGVSLSIPIFQGGKTYNRVKQTQIQIRQLDWTRINAERNLRMQTQAYLDNMNTSIEQLGSNKQGVMQAEKGRTIAQRRYEVGAGTILELNDSEVSLTQARLAYNQSIYDFLVSKADMDKVLGKDDYLNLERNY